MQLEFAAGDFQSYQTFSPHKGWCDRARENLPEERKTLRSFSTLKPSASTATLDDVDFSITLASIDETYPLQFAQDILHLTDTSTLSSYFEEVDTSTSQCLEQLSRLELKRELIRFRKTFPSKRIPVISPILRSLFGPPRLKHRLVHQRSFLYALTMIDCDSRDDPLHRAMLLTLFRSLISLPVDCSVEGPHWELIGFQGDYPCTDFRSCGILALVSLIYFARDQPNLELKEQVLELSVDAVHNFPLCLVGINLTRILLRLLREKKLHKVFNRHDTVVNTFLLLFCALFQQFLFIWIEGKFTINRMHIVIRKLERLFSKKPETCLKQYLSSCGKEVDVSSALSFEFLP